MGGSRLAYRAWKEHRLYGLLQQRGEAVLVMGAGDTAVSLVRELSHSKTWNIVGLLDDDTEKQGRHLHGINVLGPQRITFAPSFVRHQISLRATRLFATSPIIATRNPSSDSR